MREEHFVLLTMVLMLAVLVVSARVFDSGRLAIFAMLGVWIITWILQMRGES